MQNNQQGGQGGQSGQMQQGEGTSDQVYNAVSVLYHALQGVENCQTYTQGSDGQARQFFEQAAQMQQQIAEQGKQCLAQMLSQESGGQGQQGTYGEGFSGSQAGRDESLASQQGTQRGGQQGNF